MSFRALHVPGDPLLMPNPWDAGSARLLRGLGFKALASTSAGAAFGLGRSEGSLSMADLVEAAALIARTTDLPVNADLENCGPTPRDVARTITLAADAGIAGGSVEDFSGDPDAPIYPMETAIERVEIAVEAARAAKGDFVLTARAEGRLHGKPDLDEIIDRLNAYAEVGADVLYAPGLTSADEIAQVCKAVPLPVNVLVGNTKAGFTVPMLAQAGVARISLGSAPARQAYGGLIAFSKTLRDEGRFAYDTLAGFDEIEALLKA